MAEREALAALAHDLGDDVQRDVSLARLTTYGVGGQAAALVRVRGEDHLHEVAVAVARSHLPVLVVGLGSNLLVADDGFAGVVVVLGEAFAGVAIEDTTVRAGGRAKLPVVARQSAAGGLTGFEWAAGVPGSIGGAVRMNAGVPDADMADALSSVKLVDLGSGLETVVGPQDLALGYRTSSVTDQQVVVWAELALERGDPQQAQRSIRQKTQWRREHQPGGRNAGSVFTNPPGDSAGRLIDAAGCKGLRIGSAEISPKHANFIVVDENGRAADVWQVMDEVRQRVFAHSGVVLHAETVMVGLPALTEVPS
jgi:UDP-N-acetylmuramate dehydrogenase